MSPRSQPPPPEAGVFRSGSPQSLRLVVVDGPPLRGGVFLPEAAPVEIGRHSAASFRLDDPTVSRQHAALTYERGDWMLADLGSRAGTLLNERRVARPVPLETGDLIDIGPWRFRVINGAHSGSTLAVRNDVSTTGGLQTVAVEIERPIEAQRLSLLLEYADELHGAEDEADLLERLLHAAALGAGFEHGVVVQGLNQDQSVNIIARRGEVRAVSRTVLSEAEKGQLVRLRESPELQQAHSLVMEGVEDALCVPVRVGDRPYAYLYLTRKDRGDTGDEPQDFCLALVRLAEIALSGLRRRGLEREIKAAHDAQKRLLPRSSGTAAGLRYAMLSRPGRGVAGDLFDVVPLGGERTAVLLGDITGKGAGPGLLMSAAQAFLNGVLRRGASLDEAVAQLDSYLISRSMPGEFLTLWIGVYDASDRSLEHLDAGHGFAALVASASEPRLIESEGGPPLGIDGSFDRRSETLTVGRGDHLFLFSDGLVEQKDPQEREFGLPAVLERLATLADPEERVKSLADAVVRHAAGGVFTDDLTLACVEFTA